MSNQVVKVKREMIAACMTCPLCNKLFRDATTISECLHTFCRKCIYKKLSDEELECCPICNIDLGCVPLEKLRPDHNLQDVRAKIFPYKRRKVKAPEIPPSVTLPVRRKERSLSSLVVSTPRVSAQSGMTGRRSKSIARKSLRGSSFSIEKPVKKEEDSGEDRPESSSSPETLNKFTQNIRQGSAAKSEPPHSGENEGHARKSKGKELGQKSKLQDEKNTNESPALNSERPKKLRRIRQKKAPAFADFNVTPQAVLDGVSARCEKRINPIWFSLVATKDQDADASLPQISASYLRIKDGNITVSFIQKYLMRKLDLPTEDEVEIRCMGQSLVPTLPLNELVDFWLQNTTSERVPAIIGSSAKDFVMVLAYGRKIPTA
ncbi:E3 ubiquitin protein ligase DRIP2-like isoform X2 [Coffea eugenioides]|uniref:E3 ubiquitin protein ligase DRIP2-like isoform X2 n=1 Tax=Coffea eugenioides TaxID=49369 RepID=UPI000F615752|nr:E3 ubiquitin protein ligase DRIP2-like isoform X2 [Coffea eugenioides]